MPKRKRPEEKPEDQFKRFVEAAREHGVDEHAEKRIEKIVKQSAANNKKS